jgi:hypothetical protein
MGKIKNIKNYFFLIGLAIILIGFLYDIVFAGIPLQDAPIPVIIKQLQQHKIAEEIKRVGFIIFIIGIIVRLIFYLKKVISK